jgi:hypothetical protein
MCCTFKWFLLFFVNQFKILLVYLFNLVFLLKLDGEGLLTLKNDLQQICFVSVSISLNLNL